MRVRVFSALPRPRHRRSTPSSEPHPPARPPEPTTGICWRRWMGRRGLRSRAQLVERANPSRSRRRGGTLQHRCRGTPRRSAVENHARRSDVGGLCDVRCFALDHSRPTRVLAEVVRGARPLPTGLSSSAHGPPPISDVGGRMRCLTLCSGPQPPTLGSARRRRPPRAATRRLLQAARGGLPTLTVDRPRRAPERVVRKMRLACS